MKYMTIEKLIAALVFTSSSGGILINEIVNRLGGEIEGSMTVHAMMLAIYLLLGIWVFITLLNSVELLRNNKQRVPNSIKETLIAKPMTRPPRKK